MNDSDITITWRLRTLNYRSLRDQALESARDFDEASLLMFMLTTILGDGTAYIGETHRPNGRINDKPYIEIKMTSRRIER